MFFCRLSNQHYHLHPQMALLTPWWSLPHQPNQTQALGKMRNTIILLVTRIDISNLLERLLVLFVKTIEAVRPGRCYQRKKKVKVPKYFMAYKRFA